MKANGFKNQPPAGNTAKIFGISFVFSLVMAFNLAKILDDPVTTAAWGATAGFLAGFGWCFMGIGIIRQFERKPWSYVLINGGFLTVALTVMGLIPGAGAEWLSLLNRTMKRAHLPPGRQSGVTSVNEPEIANLRMGVLEGFRKGHVGAEARCQSTTPTRPKTSAAPAKT
jgi:hypothetical protein